MKKPCKDVITGLKTELNIKLIFPAVIRGRIIIFFLICSSQIFPQIPINGFCKFNAFQIDSGYNNLYTLNFNNDSYTDLFLFKSGSKTVVAVSGNQNGSFSNQKKYELPFYLSKIKSLYDENNMIVGHAFTSRRERIAGIYNFNEKGEPALLTSKKFDTYPENISTGKTDAEGSEKILISGSGFEGLTLLSLQDSDSVKNELIEKKIAENSVFSESVFADLNNDGINDIAAFDLLNNSLVFFYNNSIGEFTRIRSIDFPEQISSLFAFDLNLDFYQDLVFVKGNSITVMYGDFSSSYSNVISLNTQFYPDRFITGDFNRDGRIDIAYINFRESILAVLFAKNENEFYNEIIYFQKEELTNLVPYYSKFINGVTVISNSGSIYSITRLTTFSLNNNISIGVNPSAISSFDNENNGINDICFIDNYDNKLKLIVRNSAGIPSFFYSFSLFRNNDEILVFDKFPRNKNFYCYKNEENIVEVISFNLEKNKVDRSSLYVPGKIKEAKIIQKDNETYRLYIAYAEKNKLNIRAFNVEDKDTPYRNYENIVANFQSVTFSGTNGITLYFWQNENKNLTFNRIKLENNSKKKEQILSFSPKEKIKNIVSFTGNLLNNEKDVTISFINDSLNRIYLKSQDFLNVFSDEELLKKLKVTSKKELFFGESKINNFKNLFIYNPFNKKLYKIDFLRNGKELIASKLIENINIKRFFIKNMNLKKYHLVYINSLQNCISVVQL